jgi:hypothetical protein
MDKDTRVSSHFLSQNKCDLLCCAVLRCAVLCCCDITFLSFKSGVKAALLYAEKGCPILKALTEYR